VLVDPSQSPAWYFDRLQAAGATVVRGLDPTALPRAAKNPVEVQGAQITRPTSSAAAPTAANATPTLPNTGDSTLGIALAGIGSLLVGGAALWWGARHARRHPTGVLD
jgi:LPXTG-motif cell wall-anchored protein